MNQRSKIGCFRKAKITFQLLVIGGFFIWPFFSSGETNKVVINEIVWMGTTKSANDEWIELYNNTSQVIDLTGWILQATDGTPEIALTGTIPAQGYFLLERTDDQTVPEIPADQIYTGTLNNKGETLELRDAQNNLIDQIDCSEGWFAGDNETKQTMERKNSQNSGNDSNNWQSSQDIGGTPKAQNSSGRKIPPLEESTEEQPTEQPSTDGSAQPTPANHPPVAEAGSDITALANQEIFFDASQSSDPDNDNLTFFWNFGDGATDSKEKTSHIYLYPAQYIVTLLVSDGEFSDLDIITVNIYSQSVIISEFIPNPKGPDTENEWIELFNQSDQIANLTGWQLDNQTEGSQPFVFPVNSFIAPHQFLVLRRPITKLALNNDRDQVRLIYPDGSLASQVSYSGEKKEGFSIAFDGQDYFWTKIPTPGMANIISPNDLKNGNKNLSNNNPQPFTQETQEPPKILAKINLSQSQKFSTFNPPAGSVSSLTHLSTKPAELSQSGQPIKEISGQPTNISSQQSASLVQSNQKANLILVLSIIISGSLLASWFLISIRKRIS
jgi:hypothetical protein